jgi:hypothetical protein
MIRVTLTGAATEAVSVALTAEPALPSLPAELVVAAGANSATSSPIQTPIDRADTFQLTARLGEISRTATLVVTAGAPELLFLALLPNVRDVNELFTLIVGLSAAPAEATVVSLESSPPIPTLPPSVTVESGDFNAQIQVSSNLPGTFVVTATLGAQRLSSSLTVTPSGTGTDLVSLQVIPDRIPQNAQFNVIASIKNPAGDTPVNIALSSSPGIGSLPNAAVIPAHSDFTMVSNLAAPATGSYTIRAVGGANTLEARLTVA